MAKQRTSATRNVAKLLAAHDQPFKPQQESTRSGQPMNDMPPWQPTDLIQVAIWLSKK